MSAPMTEPSLVRFTSWMRDGTGLFLAALAAVPDAALTAPSRLPGWSRAHVVSHVARNADGLCNLLSWARTGVETPMYVSQRARAAGIEAGVGRSPAAIRADAEQAAQRLAAVVGTMPDPAWSSEVRTAALRLVPATEITWMRAREVWVHAVDLDAGISFGAVPADLAQALLDDALGSLGKRPGSPQLTVGCTEADRTWQLGDGSAGEVSGPYAALLSWALGRRGPDVADWPALPAWL
jgi:maleylpyruvate isomerase